ncbi:MAG: DUF4252 domain-containing protein [Saprospiraceae bacterium]|nr:DUF4252 domain-containing protein [Saprospiraceae bacterium]
MRLLIFVISFILSCSPGYSQKYLKKFISDLKNTDEYSQWKIPTKVFKKEIKLGFKKSEIESNLNKVNSGINAVYEHNTEITDMEIEKITKIMEDYKKKMIKNDSFSEKLSLTNADENISVLTLEKNDTVTKILVLYQKKSEVRVYDFSTTIRKNEFDALVWRREFKKF